MYRKHINQIIGYEMNNLPSAISGWFSEAEIESNVSASLETFFENNFNGKSDQAFRLNKDFPEAVEEDFKMQIIDLGNNKFAVTIIEVKQDYQQMNAPVIELAYKNFKMSDVSREELDKLIYRYELFKPGWIRYYESYDENSSGNIFEAVRENITFAGSIEAVKQLPKNENYERIKIEELVSMDFYPEYSKEYDLFFKSNEGMRNKIEKELFETLERILENGYLYKATIDNEIAGVFAIIKSRQLYFKSYFVREEILYEKFRGRGYASVFQRKVIESLPADEIKIICGMIHTENKSSLRTAMSCGRKEIETNFLIKLKY